jgi:FkbM family methyltransferase
MYSQNDEERHILAFFKNHVGRLLDIGAYDGRTFSNTCRLIELGWSAVMLEPSPSVFPRLLERHGANPRVTLVQAAVSDHNGTQCFFDAQGDAIATLDRTHMHKWARAAGVKFTAVEVPTLTTADLFAAHGLDFDFINLDVEGINWEIFRLLELEKLHALKLICVEHDGWMTAMRNILEPLGFREITCNAENLLAGR